MNETRKLATITTVKELLPIPGADLIEVCLMTTNSWTVIVKKGDLNVGDPCVYFEIDSFLPKEKRYAFLDGRSNKTLNGIEGYRLKTIRLRGQISQGLVLPIFLFPEIMCPKEGNDVTALLGIKEYEIAEVQLSRYGHKIATKAKKFPYFIPKTDQERIQSIRLDLLERLKYHRFEVTVKMDGSSMTAYVHKGNFGVCSRNLEVYSLAKKRWFHWFWKMIHKLIFKVRKKGWIDKTLYEDTAIQYGLEQKMLDFHQRTRRSIAIQGELCGEGVQGNRERIPGKEVRFYCFDIYDIDRHKYMTVDERLPILEEMGIESVLILEKSAKVLDPFEGCVQRILAMTEGEGLYTKNREGLVFKDQDDTDWHFKAISNQYLLTYDL
jgi:RNA ligase (TIGR02306 family)